MSLEVDISWRMMSVGEEVRERCLRHSNLIARKI